MQNNNDGENRPDRTGRQLHGVMETFELERVVNWLRDEAEYSNKGRNALTLVKNPQLRTVLMCMQKGEVMHDHRAPGPITVQVLHGRIRFELEPGTSNHQPIELDKGQLLVLEETLKHEVTALEECSFLLTIVMNGPVDELHS